MKCPHCLVDFHSHPSLVPVTHDRDGDWSAQHDFCPSCKRAVIYLRWDPIMVGSPMKLMLIHPKSPSRTLLSSEVPDEFAADYREACLVLADSPKASAALSRRCLQNILHNKCGIKKRDLAQEIQQVIDDAKMPTHILDALDGIRNIGNFAAHPIKATSSGEIVEVEPAEAEWTLDVLESLFDHLFVQPAAAAKKKAAMNAKLASAGKPPMK